MPVGVLLWGLTLLLGAAPAVLGRDEDPTFVLTAERKQILKEQVRLRPQAERIVAIQELARFHDLDAVKLILQFGLRDGAAVVQAAAIAALQESHRDAAIGRFLVEHLKHEWTSVKNRTQNEYCQRLLIVICEFHHPEIYAELLALANLNDARRAPTIAEAMMNSFDSAAKQNDATVLAILPDLATSRLATNSFGFQRCVMETAAKIQHVDAVAFLIQQLPQLDGELRQMVVRSLRQITHQALSADHVAWTAWWKKHRMEFRYPEQLSQSRAVVDDGTPHYYDFPIHAQRVVFILDTSKSMGAAVGMTRLESAKRELLRTIDQLPEQTSFSVIVFNSTVLAWNERLVPASADWKTHAKAFVQAQRPAGKTATYDALHTAFQISPNTEAIYLLSDGSPSDGTILPPERILDAVRKTNHNRRITINTIGLFAGESAADAVGLEEFMRRLAEENRGEYRRVN